MSGETQSHQSGWSVDTLKAHYDQRFVDSEKAIIKAETASEKRFESVNEFRAQLADQAATFMPRAESNSKFEGMSDKISAITDRLNTTQGEKTGSEVTKADVYRAVGAGVGVLGFAITVIVLLIGAK